MAVPVRAPNPEAEAARPDNPFTIRQTRNYAVPRMRHWRLEFYSLREADGLLDLPLAFRVRLRRWIPPNRDCGFFWVFYNANGVPKWTLPVENDASVGLLVTD